MTTCKAWMPDPTEEDLTAAALNIYQSRLEPHQQMPDVEDIPFMELFTLKGLAEVAIYAYLGQHRPTPEPPPLPEGNNF